MQGYIKLHRDMLETNLWSELTPEGRCVWIAILCGASYRESCVKVGGEEIVIQPGQWLTSIGTIARKAGPGISVQNVRTALAQLKARGYLTDHLTKTRRRILTIVYWNHYQNSCTGVTDRAEVIHKESNPILEKRNNKNTQKGKPPRMNNQPLVIEKKVRDRIRAMRTGKKRRENSTEVNTFEENAARCRELEKQIFGD